MGHLFFTPLWIWDGSAHKRTIQGLQTSRQTAPVPCSACLLSAWRGRVSYWTHAATVSPEKRRADPVTVRWLCSYTLCINSAGLPLVLIASNGCWRQYQHSACCRLTWKHVFIIDSVFCATLIAWGHSLISIVHVKKGENMLRFVVKAFIIFIALQANTDSLMRKGWKALQVFFFSAEDEV